MSQSKQTVLDITSIKKLNAKFHKLHTCKRCGVENLHTNWRKISNIHINQNSGESIAPTDKGGKWLGQRLTGLA
jgi:hypothetical protein